MPQPPSPEDRQLFPADPESRKRVIAAILFAVAALGVGYIGMYLPVHRALSSGGALRYYARGVALPPVFLYLAILVVTVDVRDGQIFFVNRRNKRTLTRKGWFIALGAVAVAALSLGAWTLYLRALGFHSAS